MRGGHSTGLLFGLVFVFAGLAFKISAVPFHMWTPDVYEGAPTPVTAFFASAPKVAAMAMATRVAVDAMGPATDQWRQIVIFAALASIIFGAVAAIGQTNIKRLLAYSSINNVGFVLIGLACGTADGVASVLTYLAIYVAMTLGSFIVVLQMRDADGQPVETIASLSGLSQTRKGLALALAIFMFSLAGIPPLFGFYAKLAVFTAAVNAGLYALAVVGIVGSVIGAYYYLQYRQDDVLRRAGRGVRAARQRARRRADRGCGGSGVTARLSRDPAAGRWSSNGREGAVLSQKSARSPRPARPMPICWIWRATARQRACGCAPTASWRGGGGRGGAGRRPWAISTPAR